MNEKERQKKLDLCEELYIEFKLLMKKYFEKGLDPRSIGGVMISTAADFLFFATQGVSEEDIMEYIALAISKGKSRCEKIREEIARNER